MSSHFIIFLDIDTMQAVEIQPHGWQKTCPFHMPPSWLLMTWWWQEPRPCLTNALGLLCKYFIQWPHSFHMNAVLPFDIRLIQNAWLVKQCSKYYQAWHEACLNNNKLIVVQKGLKCHIWCVWRLMTTYGPRVSATTMLNKLAHIHLAQFTVVTG